MGGETIAPVGDLRSLLVEADSFISHMRHRGSWPEDETAVDGLIGRLRRASESLDVYRVYESSYEGEYTLKCFGDKDTAIAYARDEARKRNEEFTGNIGHGVGIEVLHLVGGESEDVEGWQDWAARIEGARFVVASDERSTS